MQERPAWATHQVLSQLKLNSSFPEKNRRGREKKREKKE